MGFYKDKLVASGKFSQSIEEAEENLKSLSEILIYAKFDHQILLDDETGYLYKTFTHNWTL